MRGYLIERGRRLLLWGAPTTRGCSIEEGRKLLYWDGAPTEKSFCEGLLDRGREEVASGKAPVARGCFLDRGREEAASGGAPAARGCFLDREREREKRRCFWGSFGCAGLLD